VADERTNEHDRVRGFRDARRGKLTAKGSDGSVDGLDENALMSDLARKGGSVSKVRSAEMDACWP
jgi:hypothetical protein